MKIRGNTVGTPIKPKQVLVKCEDLTPEEQAQVREKIGAASAKAIGDIESALDEIIGIQDGILGTVNFTYDGAYYHTLPGMTWEEWCNSIYNVDGFYVDEDAICIATTPGNYAIVADNQGTQLVSPTDIIMQGYAYSVYKP